MEKKKKTSSGESISPKKSSPNLKPGSKVESKVKPQVTPKVKPEAEKVKVDMPTLQELLESGSHFGHKTSRWNPKMEKFIFDTRAGIHIIDLTQTLGLIKNAVEFLAEASKTGNVLLVGTKGQAATLIKTAGVDHGSFYISRRWPGGLLTNFKNIRRSVKRLMQIEEDLAAMKGYETKKERLVLERDRDRLLRLYEGIRFMEKKPVAMVVIDTRIEKNAIREAKKLGVKVVGLVDTNCDPTLIDYPVPANDDAIRSIKVFVNVLVQGFSNSSTSADLIGRRNDYLTGLSKTQKLAELEAERVKKEKDLEIRRLKAMKEGKSLEGGSAERKVVRIVRKSTVAKPESDATKEKETTPKVRVSVKKEKSVKKAVVKKAAAKKIVIKKVIKKKKAVKAKVAKTKVAKKTKAKSRKKKTVKSAAKSVAKTKKAVKAKKTLGTGKSAKSAKK